MRVHVVHRTLRNKINNTTPTAIVIAFACLNTFLHCCMHLDVCRYTFLCICVYIYSLFDKGMYTDR